jgi:hypothetical protein
LVQRKYGEAADFAETSIGPIIAQHAPVLRQTLVRAYSDWPIEMLRQLAAWQTSAHCARILDFASRWQGDPSEFRAALGRENGGRELLKAKKAFDTSPCGVRKVALDAMVQPLIEKMEKDILNHLTY